MTAFDIINKYITFFEEKGHKRIANSPLVPLNDPTTLFTSSGMQPLVPYLLGEEHPLGARLLNVQNVFRAVDIEEVGDNRHTTFFRMLGNWSLGDYFKKDQLNWFFTFLTRELGIDSTKLFITIFKGSESVSKDHESQIIWEKDIFNTVLGDFAKKNIREITINDTPEKGIKKTDRIFYYGEEKNWWSRSGTPDKMPPGEPGGPDSEVFYDFGEELGIHENSPFSESPCHPNCDCGRFMEIGNSVFMQYIKQEDGFFNELPKQNVDFGGGVERQLAATENQSDMFKTNLLYPIIKIVEKHSRKPYEGNELNMRIVTDHFVSACMITNSNIKPSNTDQGYILRRLIRRGLDNFNQLSGSDISPVLETIVEQYKDTDPELVTNYEKIKLTILEEANKYQHSKNRATAFISKRYKKTGDELMGSIEITPDDAFIIYTTHGLSPTQIKSLGYTFDEKAFAEKMKGHKDLSRAGAGQRFKGGLADTQERTVMGHTATHLMHQALRDMFGNQLHQTGSNITTERVRFDFNFDRKLADEEITQLEHVVNQKIKDNLPVHFEMIPTTKAKEMGAIGLFEDTYQDTSKIYFIGGSSTEPEDIYSIEFCGGPHVDFTSKVKSFKIIKQENIGNKQRRLYAVVG